MKRILLAGLAILAFSAKIHADELAGSYDTIPKLHYENSNVATSTQIIAIDLSDTANYPHFRNGYIAIGGIRTTFDVPANSSGTIKFGVVTFVNASTGTVKWFAGYPFFSGAIATLNFSENFMPGYLRTLVKQVVNANGTTPYFASNTTTSGSTAYQTDVPLPTGIGGSATPAIGDIILAITVTAGSINDFVAEVFYAGQKP